MIFFTVTEKFRPAARQWINRTETIGANIILLSRQLLTPRFFDNLAMRRRLYALPLIV